MESMAASDNLAFEYQGEIPSISAAVVTKKVDAQENPLTSNATAMEMPRHHEHDYGCGNCFPRRLQCLNNVRAHVLFHCLFNFFEGFIVNGVINVIISALETRYKLNSTRSGLIASGNDFGAFPVFLFVGYFVEGRRKPLWMGLGVFVMALGSWLFVLPHFLSEIYEYTVTGASNTSVANLCAAGPQNATCDTGTEEESSRLYPLFMVGQVLLGVGAVPMFTVGLTYIDENTKPKMTSFYTGIIFASAAAGVAVGYVTAGQTLSLFIDVNRVDSSSVLLTPSDPQWVGAWWIGVLIAGGAFLVIGIPICGYPKYMPGFNSLQQARSGERQEGATQVPVSSKVNNIKDFPRSFAVLLRNPTFLLLCLGATFDALIISGTATFGAKLLQEFFQIDLTEAGTIMGVITVPGAGGGMLLGGWLVKNRSLRCRGMLRLCMAFTLLSLLLSPAFFAQCSRIPIAGVDVAFANSSSLDSRLVSKCNKQCNCDTKGMEPVCFQDTVVFFSPCHAGCTRVVNENGTKTYINCTCTNIASSVSTFSSVVGDPELKLVSGSCVQTCALKYVFCFLFFCIMVCTFATMSPNITTVMRCVPFNQRSQAIGLQLLAARLLGTTPGPVLFGVIVDSACDVWQESSCGGRGACWIYNQQSLALRIMLWWITLKVCGAVAYGVASCLYKDPTEKAREIDVVVGPATS